jgi:hypothetical protein
MRERRRGVAEHFRKKPKGGGRRLAPTPEHAPNPRPLSPEKKDTREDVWLMVVVVMATD